MNQPKLPLLLDTLNHQDYAVIADFFSPEQVACWRDDARSALQQGLFAEARVGAGNSLQREASIRRDEILWLDPAEANAAQKSYLDFLEQLRLALNAQFMLGLFAVECHYAHYQIGSFYKKHLDRHLHSRERVVSVISYLNDNWSEDDGGELRLYLKDGDTLDVKPQPGTLVCFFSEALPHEVLPVNRERISLTAWLRIRSSEAIG